MMILRRIFGRLFAGKSSLVVARLGRGNVLLAVLYAAQAAALLLFSTPYHVAVTVLYQTTDSLQAKLSGHPAVAPAVHQLASVNLTYIVAGFLLVSAMAHMAAATLWRRQYETALKKCRQPLRWLLYAVSGGMLAVSVALLAGAHDLGTLAMLAVLSAVAGLSGLLMEIYNPMGRRRRHSWPIMWVGGLAAAAAWLVILLYAFSAPIFGNGGSVPRASAWIIPSAAALMAAIGLNLWLTYARKGKWASYLYGEAWYMGLAFLLQSAVAWECFIGVLRP